MMRVCVVDDDAIVVRSLETILCAEDDIEVAGTGFCAADTLALVGELAPDMLLCNIQMPDGLDLEAAKKLLALTLLGASCSSPRFSDDEHIVRTLRAACAGQRARGRGTREGREPSPAKAWDARSSPYSTGSTASRQMTKSVGVVFDTPTRNVEERGRYRRLDHQEMRRLPPHGHAKPHRDARQLDL